MYNLNIGVIKSIDDVLVNGVSALDEVGLSEIQLNCWNVPLCTKENAEKIKEMFGDKYTISGIWAGWVVGPTVWNFIDGPQTIGIVPETWRRERMEGIKKIMDFANMLNLKTVTTHMGFMPENPNTKEYRDILDAIYELCEYANQYGINFCFETGQETPITLKRTILAVGTGNLGINLDPANLLLYGKANPCDAVDIFGEYVRGVHAKDGEYPTDPRYIGAEKRLGDGRVNFPVLMKKLMACGYNGSVTIEREIDGDKQIEDILYAKKFLEDIING